MVGDVSCPLSASCFHLADGHLFQHGEPPAPIPDAVTARGPAGYKTGERIGQHQDRRNDQDGP